MQIFKEIQKNLKQKRSKRTHMNMKKLSLGVVAPEKKEVRSYDEESNIHAPITVVLKLPDGSTKEFAQTTGDTIQIIKKKIEVELGFPYHKTSCFYAGKLLIEPLSLNDFPDLPKDKPVIDVRVST